MAKRGDGKCARFHHGESSQDGLCHLSYDITIASLKRGCLEAVSCRTSQTGARISE